MTPNDPPLALSDISTTWRKVHEPLQFVLAYGPAARAYLLAILRDVEAADDVLQQVLLQVTEKGFPTLDPTRGKFRHYLKSILRNAAYRHRRADRPSTDADPETIGENVEEDNTWRSEWQTCVLNAAWRGLERHQRQAKRGNLAYTVLRLTADHPADDATTLAEMATANAGQPLSVEAFRQQLSRARRMFAELIIVEIRQSLDGGTDGDVVEELAELGLLRYVRDYLPSDHRL